MNKYPVHKWNGWILADYSWDEETGEATFTYERTTDGVTEETVVTRKQMKFWIPAALREVGWDYNEMVQA